MRQNLIWYWQGVADDDSLDRAVCLWLAQEKSKDNGYRQEQCYYVSRGQSRFFLTSILLSRCTEVMMYYYFHFLPELKIVAKKYPAKLLLDYL